MEDMDIDCVTEVPDTPDRLRTQFVNQQIEKITNTRAVASSNNSHIIDERSCNRLRRVDMGSGRGRGKRLNMHPPKRIGSIVKSGDCCNPICISPSSNCRFTSGHNFSRQQNINQNSKGNLGKPACMERGDSRSVGGSHGYTEILGDAFLHDSAEISVDGKRGHAMPNSFKTFSMSSKGKEKVCDPGTNMPCGTSEIFSKMRPQSSCIGSSSRHIGQKRLVRNGCISPNNIATRNREFDERRNNGTQKIVPDEMCYQVADDCWLSPEFRQLIAKEKALSDRNKGKEILVHPAGRSNHDMSKSNISSRNISLPSHEEGSRTNSAVPAVDGVADLGRWRTTHGNSVLCHNLNKEKGLCSGKDEAGSSVNGYYNMAENENGHRRFRRQIKKGITSDSGTNASRLGSQQSELMILGSSGDSSVASMECHGPLQQSSSCAVNLEDISPRTRPQNLDNLGSLDDASRARQVEADEILALALQEQLYNESQSVENNQCDDYAAIMRMIQDEEDDRQASHISSHHVTNSIRGNSFVTNSRDSVRGRMRRAPQPRVSWNPSNRRSALAGSLTHARLQESRRPRTRSSSFLSGESALHFPRDMELEVRLDVLEALESVLGDTSNPETSMDFFGTQRDFTEEDYEMLLALDENNIRTGASARQISSLPESKVQNDSIGEACTICLEVPAMGDTIRHLPCLHKFHKDCIDPWLSRSRSCPVCKSSIS